MRSSKVSWYDSQLSLAFLAVQITSVLSRFRVRAGSVGCVDGGALCGAGGGALCGAVDGAVCGAGGGTFGVSRMGSASCAGIVVF